MAFSNSIAAGEKLIRESLQSENYDPGVAGWAIFRDGTAEFESLSTRGAIKSNSEAPGVSGYEVGMNAGTVYSARVNEPTDQSILEIQSNVITWHSPDTNTFAHASLDNTGRLTVSADNGLELYAETTLVGVRVPTDGYLRRLDNGVIETWHEVGAVGEPIFDNLFSNLGGGWETLAFRKFPDGTVCFKGSVTKAAAAGNDLQVFQLPVGYRPTSRRGFAVGNLSSHATADEPMVRVYANGAVTIWGMAAAAPTAFALDGIRYSIIA